MITIVLSIICLIFIFIQDIKFRKIHVLFPVILFISGLLIIKNQSYNTLAVIKIISYNTLFFFITFGILVLYISIKNRQFSNPFKNYFGLGDLLLYIAISPFFLLHNYILFFIASMVFSLILYYAFIKKNTIPLAGFSSLLLLLILCKDIFIDTPALTLIK